MTNQINFSFYKILMVFMTFLSFSEFSFAQNITGSISVQSNSTETYIYNDGIIYAFDNWVITNGTLISESNLGTVYSATVQWGSVGSGSVTFRDRTRIKGTLDISVVLTQSNELSNENYIYNVSPTIPTTDIIVLSANEKMESITYFDGLGRAMQQVVIESGGNSEDIITHIDYDEFGRSPKEYLSYTSSVAKSSYRSDALNETLTFYDNTKYESDFPGMSIATINPYSEKLFEASPFNSRVLQQAAPGADWALNSGHEINFDYQTNIGLEVKLYSVSLVYANNTYTPTLNGGSSYYSAGELYKTITYDENHISGLDHSTEEFKDKQGRVILKRTYEGSVKHDTYYIYDDYGNLTYVLPPKAEPHTAKPDATELVELCYQYKYDHLNRLIEKKIPGKGTATNWEEIVYNKLDQPILTSDPNLKEQGKWLFTKYDAFGRVAYTGILNSSATRIALQTIVDGVSAQFVTKSNTATTIDGTTVYYNNEAYPITGIDDILTINYYDNYIFDKVIGNSETSYGITPITNAKGLATGSKVHVLGTNDWITTVSYYDTKARPVYVYSNNAYLSTTDKIKSKLDFVGKVEETTSTHAKTGQSTITIVDIFEYDHMGRLLTQNQEIGLHTEAIVANTYDDLGQLEIKKVGNTTSIPLQTVDYTYNVRGWLKQINNPASLGTDLFSFKLGYNEGANPLYNGNITLTQWKTANTDSSLKSYDYTYDALNRITAAISNNSHYHLDFVAYDLNGNITSLKRQGHTQMNNEVVTSYGVMDDLDYNYYPNSNKLQSVQELLGGNSTYGFKDGINQTTEFTYDSNGNMLRDYNKGISSNITYNHLNLPTNVPIPGGNIQYIYDATGVKLKKIVSTGTTTDYAENFIYENNVLMFFNQPEGYVEPDGTGGFDYVYQYKDHLGNIRLSYKDISLTSTPNLEIVEENNYYPFGLKHKGYNNVFNGRDHKYGFGGKEEQDELGLGWIDITARNYDPALGRWMNLDPLAEQMRRHSPYNYAFNNPIYFIDPDGMAPTDWFVNSLTGALTYIKGVSELNQETANKAFGPVISDAMFGSKDNQFANWERLGDDNMFDTSENKLSETSTSDYKSSEQSEEFANDHGLTKVNEELIEETTTSIVSTWGAEERNTTENSHKNVLDSKISYSSPDQVGKITPISEETIGNRMEATITTKTYTEVVNYNTGERNNNASRDNMVKKGSEIAKIIFDIIGAF